MRAFKNKPKGAILKRLLLLLLSILFLLFTAINGIWYFGYRQRYNTLAKHLEVTYLSDEESNDALRYTKEVGDYKISMKLPDYLGSGGYLSISKIASYEVSLDDEGNILESSGTDITLFIWPKYFSGYKMGVFFYNEANSIWYQVYVNSDLELTNTYDSEEDTENILKLLSENQDEIKELIRIAKENLEIDIAR